MLRRARVLAAIIAFLDDAATYPLGACQ